MAGVKTFHIVPPIPNPTTDSPLDIFARVRAILECPPASESMHYMDPQATREMINLDKNANF